MIKNETPSASWLIVIPNSHCIDFQIIQTKYFKILAFIKCQDYLVVTIINQRSRHYE